MLNNLEEIATAVEREIVRQDNRWKPFENSRSSLRLGFACLEDELLEAMKAWEDDRHDDFCGLGFMHTQEELVQTIAVATRLLLAFP